MAILPNTFENSKYHHSNIHSSLLLFLVFSLIFVLITGSASASVYLTDMAQVDSSSPNTNYGGLGNCDTLNYNYYIMCYVKLPVSNQSVFLHVYNNGSTGTGVSIYVTSSFNSNTITFNNRPQFGISDYAPSLTYGWNNITISQPYTTTGYIVLFTTGYSSSYRPSFSTPSSEHKPYITYTGESSNNTNAIIVSSTTDYNNSITTTTTPNIYLTTWVNNSFWSWYSPLYTMVYMIDPNGYTQPIEAIWGQTAYQEPYTILNPIKGNYIFEIYCSICYPTILASTILTYSTNATTPTDVWFNSAKVSNSLNTLSVNYHINSSQINYTATHMQLTYQGNCNVNLPDNTNIPITGYDGYKSIDTIVYNTMLNRGFSDVCVRADLMNLNNTILDYDVVDYLLYYIPDTPTPNPTPPPGVTYTPNPNATSTYPTPMPTPTSNGTVLPTYPQPTVTLPNYPNGTNTGNFTGNNATNNASGWGNTINVISGYITNISTGIGNITTTTYNLSNQLTNVNQTQSRTILLPAFTYALPSIPTGIKLLFLYVIILVGVLLIMDR
jgi:hypothetical protein